MTQKQVDKKIRKYNDFLDKTKKIASEEAKLFYLVTKLSTTNRSVSKKITKKLRKCRTQKRHAEHKLYHIYWKLLSKRRKYSNLNWKNWNRSMTEMSMVKTYN